MATADKIVNLADLKAAYDTTVRHDIGTQGLTDTQKNNATTNIGAARETVVETLTGNVLFDGTDGSASNRNCTVARVGQRYTFSRTAAHSSNSDFSLMPKMHGANYQSDGSNFNTWCAEATLKLKEGQRYRLTARIVSGAFGSGDNNSFVIYPKNESNTSLSEKTIILKTGRNSIDFTFTGTYFAVMCFVASAFYTGDTPIVIDLALEEITTYRKVGGSEPSITASADCAYVCTASSVDELTFTPSAIGICSVRFTSGSTPTVLNLPNTVKMPSWWTSPAANTTYEISFSDGYGVVASWT